jgi:hypothetical protein
MAPNNPPASQGVVKVVSPAHASIFQGLAKLSESKLSPNQILQRAYLARQIFQEDQARKGGSR